MRILTLTTAIILAFAGHIGAAVIYGPTIIGESARISDYAPTTGSGYITYDNFTPPGAASVQTVTWSGFWMGSATPAVAPMPDVLSWELSFYADNGGAPGAELASETFLAAAVSSSPSGTGVFNAGSSYNVSFYRYSVSLADPFAAAQGTQYWFSVQSQSLFDNPAFVLSGATGGDSSSFQQAIIGGLHSAGYPVAADRAILLEGPMAQAPEPATVVLLASGLVAAGLRRARRRG